MSQPIGMLNYVDLRNRPRFVEASMVRDIGDPDPKDPEEARAKISPKDGTEGFSTEIPYVLAARYDSIVRP